MNLNLFYKCLICYTKIETKWYKYFQCLEVLRIYLLRIYLIIIFRLKMEYYKPPLPCRVCPMPMPWTRRSCLPFSTLIASRSTTRSERWRCPCAPLTWRRRSRSGATWSALKGRADRYVALGRGPRRGHQYYPSYTSYP